MSHLYKINGQRIFVDTNSLKAYPITPLAYKMIGSLTPPLTKDCPSALRYSYAKYDSNDVSSAYKEIYSLYKKGLIYSEDYKDNNETSDNSPDIIRLKTDKSFSIEKFPDVLNELVSEYKNAGRYEIQINLADYSFCDIDKIIFLMKELSDAKNTNIYLILLSKDALLSDEIVDFVKMRQHYNVAIGFTISKDNIFFSENLFPLAKSGIKNITAEVTSDNANDFDENEINSICLEYEKISRAQIKKNTDMNFEFLPFQTVKSDKDSIPLKRIYLTYENGVLISPDKNKNSECKNCWANIACGNFREKEPSPLCKIEKTILECTIMLHINRNS